jgi:hypothetical protein
MSCMIALFQERTTWGNKSCRTLSLLFPLISDPERLKCLSWSDPLPTLQYSNYTLCLSRCGGRMRASGECIWVQWRPILWRGNQSNHSNCCQGWHLVDPYLRFFWSNGRGLVLKSNWLSLSPWHLEILNPPWLRGNKNESSILLEGHSTLTFM